MERHHHYQATLSVVRGISEGRIRVKRAIPIHLGPLPEVQEKKELKIAMRLSPCSCSEARNADGRRVPVPVHPLCSHDCNYILERSRHAEQMSRVCIEKAKSMVDIPIGHAISVLRGVNHRFEAAFRDVFSREMNGFKYDKERTFPGRLP